MSSRNNALAGIILAAGKGTRMKSKLPKIAHEICGKPMLQCIIDAVKSLRLKKIVIVVAPGTDIEKEVIGNPKDVHVVYQRERNGTAHAVMMAAAVLKDFHGDVLVINGDTPLITKKTLRRLCSVHYKNNAPATLLTAYFNDPTGYGRIVRQDHHMTSIVEERDAAPAVKNIKEVNAGFYIFKAQSLFSNLKKIKKSAATGEYYLTEIFNLYNKAGSFIATYQIDDTDEMMGVNHRYELAKANKIMQLRILRRLMDNGVTIIDMDNTYIEYDVRIGQDTIIYPFSLLYGNTVVGENCAIGPFAVIRNSIIGKDCTIIQSHIIGSKVKNNVRIGPFAHIRQETIINNNAGIGNFVETTRSKIGEGSRCFHLSYIGDAVIGKDVNFGAGVITANYDGKKKNTTRIGDTTKISSAVTFVAPVRVPPGSMIQVGETIDGSQRINTTRPAAKKKQNTASSPRRT